MISVIICSVNQVLFEQVSASIEETIATPFELIKLDNRSNSMGISQAYNEGVHKAKFSYICFVHEDVLFKSSGWGVLLSTFMDEHPEAGAIGIAGSRFKSLSPGSWASGLYDTDRVNVIQHEPRYNRVGRNCIRPTDESSAFAEVITLDGVFLFAKKEVCEKFPFDAHTFKKFHCYDLDFSLQLYKKWKLYVCYEVLIEHLSSGSLNREWVQDSFKLSQKWAHMLPAGELPDQQKREIEWRNKTIFFYRMRILNFGWGITLNYFLKFGYFKYFSFKRNLDFLKELIQKKLT